MNSVLVLMSTYNGEQYVMEQIKSILNQKNINVKLLIRDDGSTDNTINLIKSNKDSRITLIEGKNLGSANSFFSLIQEAERSEYYAFSDQDDVWDENKLFRAIEQMKNFIDLPVVYSSATKLVDSNLVYLKTEVKEPIISLKSAIVSNYVTGCTTVFNDILMKYLKKYQPKHFVWHDWWINLVCLSLNGKSIYDKSSYINYRQHNQNLVGGQDSYFKQWKRRFHKFKNKPYHRELIATDLLNGYGDVMIVCNKAFLECLKNYKHNKKVLIFNKSLNTGSLIIDVLFRVLIIFNKA